MFSPGSPRSSPRSPSKRKGAFFNQPPEEEWRVGALVECLCDNDGEDGGDAASSWLPVRVARRLADSLEVVMLGEGGAFEAHESFCRPLAGLDGDPVPLAAVAEGLACHVWYAQGEEYYAAVVDGQEQADTAVVTYTEFDEQEEVPVEYLRTSASIAKHLRKAESHGDFVARQAAKMGASPSNVPTTRFQEFKLSSKAAGGQKQRLPLEPKAAFKILKQESTRVFRRLKMGPRDFFNTANRHKAASLMPEEVAAALAQLTNLDVVAEDPVSTLLVGMLRSR